MRRSLQGRRFPPTTPPGPVPAQYPVPSQLFTRSSLQSASLLGPCPRFSRRHAVEPSSSVPSQTRRQRFPSEYFHLVRAHFRLVKCHHHLEQLRLRQPMTLQRTKERLAAQLCPAFPSSDFARAARAVADTWFSSSVALLNDHYQSVITATFSLIKETPLPASLLEDSISLTCHWARKQLGRKLQDDVLDRVLNSIRSNQRVLSASDPSSLPIDPSQSSEDAVQAVSPPSATGPTAEPSRDSQSHPSSDGGSFTATPRADVEVPLIAAANDLVESSVAASAPAVASTVTQQGSGSNSLNDSESSSPDAEAVLAPADPTTQPSCFILGDSNMSGFRDDRCRLLTLPNGRLSALRARLQSHAPDGHISKVFVCLSLLDRANLVATNFSSMKSLLGRCHVLFPSATLFVVLVGIPQQSTPTERAKAHELACILRNKHPSSSIILSAPSPFFCSGNVWESSTKAAVYNKIRAHLN